MSFRDLMQKWFCKEVLLENRKLKKELERANSTINDQQTLFYQMKELR
jgi:hypothetical protein